MTTAGCVHSTKSVNNHNSVHVHGIQLEIVYLSSSISQHRELISTICIPLYGLTDQFKLWMLLYSRRKYHGLYMQLQQGMCMYMYLHMCDSYVLKVEL